MRYYIKQFYCLSDSGFPLPAEVCLLFLLKEVSALGSLLLVSNQVLVQWFKELMVSRYRLSTVWNLVSTQEPAAVIVPPQHTSALSLIFPHCCIRNRQLLTSFRHFSFSFFALQSNIFFISRKNFQKQFYRIYIYTHFGRYYQIAKPIFFFEKNFILVTQVIHIHCRKTLQNT